MTHDFKTPISIISIANEFLNKIEVTENNDKIKKYTAIIKEETNRMKSMVEHILQISMIGEGNLSTFYEKGNINLIVEDILKAFSLIVTEKNGSIVFKPEAKSITLTCDTLLISSAISNLIDNAIKYSIVSPEIEILTRKVEKWVHIEVSDNGIGIEQKNIKNIFKKLYRINTINAKGFGIGLYYVKSIVDAHNGSIDVISTVGKGSTFIIKLPINHN